ncbi:hypothetical protein BKA62DRAFT_740568 [Auriculariales sp. MPI-PUGE-AT-0066]|nr:hypothetical protein BKA62DRAFT_740568 [Auriculariales sp. MPI-PUGE-AT-0066]
MVEDETGNTIWFKVRHVFGISFQNTSPPSLRWTIHTPKRGWYLRMRTPAFPPGTYVRFNPHEAAPDIVMGTLVFGCQTHAFDYMELLVSTPRSSLSSMTNASPEQSTQNAPPPTILPTGEARHNYPPSSSNDTPDTGLLITTSPKPQQRPAPPKSQISEFVLTPTSRHRVRHHGAGTTPAAASGSHLPSFLSRWLPSSMHEPKANSYTSAFELDVKPPLRRPLSPTSSPPVGGDSVPVQPPRPPPLLTFLDETGLFSVQTHGSLEINTRLEARLGVDRGFWIAVSLAFLQFLEERDAFLASEESA